MEEHSIGAKRQKELIIPAARTKPLYLEVNFAIGCLIELIISHCV